MANQKGLFLSHGARGLCVSWDQARFLGIKCRENKPLWTDIFFGGWYANLAGLIV